MLAPLILTLSTAWAGASNDFSGPVDLPKEPKSLEIESVEGHVVIMVDAAAEEPIVEATDHRPGRACQLEVKGSKKGPAKIAFGPKDQEEAKSCRLDLDITVPPAMPVTLQLGIGNVTAKGMTGPLEITSGSGDITLGDHAGSVKIELGEGDLELTSVTGDLDAHVAKGKITGSALGKATITAGEGGIDLKGLTELVKVDIGVGNVQIAYATAPTSGRLEARSSKGNVVIDLPTATAVKPELSSLQGEATNKLPEGGELEVVAVTGMGQVLLH